MKTIESERLILREWSLSDVDDMYEYAANSLVGPNAGWKPHKDKEVSKTIIEMFIQSKEVYAIVLKTTGKVIGGIGLHKRTPDLILVDLNQREIGYVLNPAYWGRGLIPEAVNTLIEFGFKELKLDLIWCGHYKENLKSKRVNEKCGFNYQFKRVEEIKLLGEEREVHYYNIMRSNYSRC
ncbi:MULTISPECIES: GNAT family N-acetyltransferase [unclassified Fusibacter]|uniref:GNAT family N-acetyltransferase n=1 Tax=unclassified Fusibacter TaxID=2624464 RepID=UPI0010136A2E|nr:MULTISPECIES: GNAT family N-acetyltransferase [unclassified Fusibacter]MCK8058163.1 GNAT family N-acetyltransferase [Fusibacter sp. A2]NPE20746.1 GNAT family N-acetyltransferase [Fusibacter sp. A1]RXV62953.1 N-acetyltransferase [Fusibacter sp. A1]